MSYWFRKRQVEGLIEKYSPYQPRDTHGRFGSGGDSTTRDLKIKAADGLNASEKAVEARAAGIVQNYRQAVSDYRDLPDSKGGRILNTDTARELSPDYNGNRALAAAVHEPSSAFIKELFKDKLAEPADDAHAQFVLFT